MVMEIKTVKTKHQLLMLQTDKNIRKDNLLSRIKQGSLSELES